tara:strand:- start:4541 stop:4759 length:219 start_codon:yes stop_codon:yes gene_type:complete
LTIKLVRKKKTIHFGAIKKDGTPYSQFKDSTNLKLYSKYDTNDKERRKLYYKRHNKNYGKYSADALSKKYLW